MRCTFPALLLVFVSSLLAMRAGAQEASPGAEAPAIRFAAPTGCGDVDDLRRATRALLLGPIPADAVLDGRVEDTAEGFRLRLRLGDSERDLRADDCASLLDAAALVWALSIDPEAGLHARAEPRESGPLEATARHFSSLRLEAATELADPTAATHHAGSPAVAPESQVAASTDPPSARRYRLSAAVGLATGASPAVAAGGELELGIRLAGVRLDLGVRGFMPRRGRVQAGSAAHGDVSLGAGFATLALPLGRGRLRAEGRATLEVGALWARGGGVAFPGRGSAPWVAMGLGVGAQLRLGRGVDLVASADALLPLNRPRFVIDGVGSVYRPGSVNLRASLGLAFHFGSRVSS